MNQSVLRLRNENAQEAQVQVSSVCNGMGMLCRCTEMQIVSCESLRICVFNSDAPQRSNRPAAAQAKFANVLGCVAYNRGH